MDKQQLSLEHQYRPPSINGNSQKAIVMLHGYGSDENDLFSFASELPPDQHIISLKAPIPMQPFGNAWYAIHFDSSDGKFSDTEQALKSRDLVVEVIDEIVERYNISYDQLTLLGFSQGTILSLAIAVSFPEKIKNVIALSGYMNEDLLVPGYETNDFSHLSVYSSHGTVDMVIPVEWARKTQPFLNDLGIENQYSEFPVGHGVAPQNFYEFKDWLTNRYN